jgi:hypothetical protein
VKKTRPFRAAFLFHLNADRAAAPEGRRPACPAPRRALPGAAPQLRAAVQDAVLPLEAVRLGAEPRQAAARRAGPVAAGAQQVARPEAAPHAARPAEVAQRDAALPLAEVPPA